MVGHHTPMERVKQLINELHKLEDKLMNTGFMPMREQTKIHEEIKRLKEAIATLERRVK
jgi:hypothetical protein